MIQYRFVSQSLLLVICILQVACTGHAGSKSPLPIDIVRKESVRFETRQFERYPVPHAFTICAAYTCAELHQVSLSETQWQTIQQPFLADLSAEQERQAIRQAIARLEQMVGNITGTSADRGRNLSGWGLAGQMDCVDEATNTTVYLTMLQNDGLLRWHRVVARQSRGISSLQVPHFTAVIEQLDDRQGYAVDSWFLDNGQPPFIVPVDQWQAGWQPES